MSMRSNAAATAATATAIVALRIRDHIVLEVLEVLEVFIVDSLVDAFF